MDYQEVSVRYDRAERKYRHSRPGTPDYEAAKRELSAAGLALYTAAYALGIDPVPIAGPTPAPAGA